MNDKEILLKWAKTYGEDKDDVRASMYDSDLMIEFAKYYANEQLSLSVVSKSVNCFHPFAYVVSRCNGELNKCMKCGKQL